MKLFKRTQFVMKGYDVCDSVKEKNRGIFEDALSMIGAIQVDDDEQVCPIHGKGRK